MTQNILSPFHLAIPVNDLASTEKFYGTMMGLSTGRKTADWIDWNLFGHQLTTHVKSDETALISGNNVDGKTVPVRHFGVILGWDIWHELRDRLIGQTVFDKIDFIIEPYIRFQGEIGEQATMFFLDSSHNALEFKSFKDMSEIFRPYDE